MDNTILFTPEGYSHREIELMMDVGDDPDTTPLSVELALPPDIDPVMLALCDRACEANSEGLAADAALAAPDDEISETHQSQDDHE